MEKTKFKYYASGRSGTREVFPINGKTFAVSYQKNSGRADFDRKFDSKLKFIGADFNWFYNLEKLIYRTEFIDIEIKRLCGGIFYTFYTGRVSLNSADPFNLEIGFVELEITQAEKYQCLETGWDQEINLFNYIATRVAVSPISGSLQRITFSENVPAGGIFNMFPGEPSPGSKGWGLESSSFNASLDFNNGSGDYSVTWIREEVTSATPLSAPWILISGDLYARTPVLYAPVYGAYNPSSPNDFSVTYRVLETSIDNGFSLRTVFETFLNSFTCGLTLESDFFQWNPVNVSADNYVTGLPSKVLNLLLFQKSDVKRPTTTNNATKAEISFEKLLQDICNLFQLEYEITIDDKFKIEHVSFFESAGLGLDTTTADHRDLTFANRVYTYDKDKIPTREVFRSMEQSFGDFTGSPIIYGAGSGEGENKEETISVEKITTDVILCLNNPNPDSIVSDSGFVLIAGDAENSIIIEPSIQGGNAVNNSLAWSQLHRDYWRHNRGQKSFTMNGTATEALSIKPTKLQKVKVKIGCDFEFDPRLKVATSLGNNGTVKSAKFNINTDVLYLDVLFPADDNLIANPAPVALTDSASTYVGEPIIINILGNDTGDFLPSTLAIVSPPSHGTATITSDFKILYTPSPGYTGPDAFYYTVKDELNESSAVTAVTITVQAGTVDPIAVDDSFSTGKNVLLSGNVIGNDTGPGALTATAETKATTSGGSVTIQANGDFEYNPPLDFTGDDSFGYTLNSNGETDTGSVSINVFVTVPVWVSLVETPEGFENISENCGGNMSIVGEQNYSDFTLYFWSNSGKTVPLNVNGYGLGIKVRHLQEDVNNNSEGDQNILLTIAGSGTSKMFSDGLGNGDPARGFRTYYDYQGCDLTANEQVNASLTLEAGSGYNI